MEAPERIHPKGLADYLEVMSKSVFQAGISWRVVESKWPGIKQAFHGFDPVVVSRLSGAELAALAEDTRIIRNRLKILAIVSNAARMLELDKEYKGFRNYLRSHPTFEDLVKDLRKQFKFIGDMGAYHFLWVVGEKVPSWDEWSAAEAAKVGSAPRRHRV